MKDRIALTTAKLRLRLSPLGFPWLNFVAYAVLLIISGIASHYAPDGFKWSLGFWAGFFGYAILIGKLSK